MARLNVLNQQRQISTETEQQLANQTEQVVDQTEQQIEDNNQNEKINSELDTQAGLINSNGNQIESSTGDAMLDDIDLLNSRQTANSKRSMNDLTM